MRKEVIFAIFFGLILGAIIIFGIQFANKASQNAATISPSPTPLVNNQAPTPTSPEEQLLTVSSPVNNSVINQSSVSITGKTFKKAIIAATSNESEVLSQASEDGTFNFSFPLVGGENQIKIQSQSTDGKSATYDLLVIYTTAKIEPWKI